MKNNNRSLSGTRMVERHIYLSEQLNEELKRDAAEAGMTCKDYISWLLSTKGRPIFIVYDSEDIRQLVNQTEKLVYDFEIISQGVEANGETEINLIEDLRQKIHVLLDEVVRMTNDERKNRKTLIAEARELIKANGG